ncbi:hypothetical protein D3C75_1068680 [compost metagenome]
MRREELQGEQIQNTTQAVRLGFDLQLIVHAAVCVADGPDVVTQWGQRAVEAFKCAHGILRFNARNFHMRTPVFFLYDR